MLFSSWLRNWKRSAAFRRAQTSPGQRAGFRPRLEAFEDRWLPSGLPYSTAATVRQLIADINYADNAGGSFTINLTPGTTFDLKTVNNTTNGANGLPVVGGAKAVDLTILGNGDTLERVGGFTFDKRGVPSNPFRLFDVAPGASLTLDHVTLHGGWAYGSVGGAIYNQGMLKVINGSTLTGNGADSGGGIYNDGGTVTVSNGTLAGNHALSFAGGIYNNGGTVTVSNGSTLSGNSASYSGGGIYTNGGTVTVSNGTLSSNAARFGGGIYNVGGTVTVSNGSTLSGNAAFHADYPWSGGDGGGIYNSGGTVTISNSILSGNTGLYGGGISNGGTVTVKNSCSITGNKANGLDEDVYNFGVLYLEISTSTIGVLHGNPAIPI